MGDTATLSLPLAFLAIITESNRVAGVVNAGQLGFTFPLSASGAGLYRIVWYTLGNRELRKETTEDLHALDDHCNLYTEGVSAVLVPSRPGILLCFFSSAACYVAAVSHLTMVQPWNL